MTATGVQGGLSIAVVQLVGRLSARVQDFYAVSVQGGLCARVDRASLIRAMVSFARTQVASSFMQIIKRIGFALAWLAGLILVFVAADRKSVV